MFLLLLVIEEKFPLFIMWECTLPGGNKPIPGHPTCPQSTYFLRGGLRRVLEFGRFMKFSGTCREGPENKTPSSSYGSLYWCDVAQPRKPSTECISLSLFAQTHGLPTGSDEVFSATGALLT